MYKFETFRIAFFSLCIFASDRVQFQVYADFLEMVSIGSQVAKEQVRDDRYDHKEDSLTSYSGRRMVIRLLSYRKCHERARAALPKAFFRLFMVFKTHNRRMKRHNNSRIRIVETSTKLSSYRWQLILSRLLSGVQQKSHNNRFRYSSQRVADQFPQLFSVRLRVPIHQRLNRGEKRAFISDLYKKKLVGRFNSKKIVDFVFSK